MLMFLYNNMDMLAINCTSCCCQSCYALLLFASKGNEFHKNSPNQFVEAAECKSCRIFSFVCDVFVFIGSFKSIFVHSTRKMQMRSIIFVRFGFDFSFSMGCIRLSVCSSNGIDGWNVAQKQANTLVEHLHICTFSPVSLWL